MLKKQSGLPRSRQEREENQALAFLPPVYPRTSFASLRLPAFLSA
jgi:hypothetical protein